MEHLKQRRKAVACVLCKTEETYDLNAVCDTCKSDWRYGRDMKAQRSAQLTADTNAPVDVGVTTRWYVSPLGWPPGKRPEPVPDLREASERLRDGFIGVIMAAGGTMRPRRGEGPDYLFNIHTYLQPFEYHSENYGDVWLVGHAVAEALEKLLRWVQSYGGACYWNGRQAGSDFLQRMADGDLSAAEINEWHDRNRKRTAGTH